MQATGVATDLSTVERSEAAPGATDNSEQSRTSGIPSDPATHVDTLLDSNEERDLHRAEALLRKWAKRDLVSASSFLRDRKGWNSIELARAVVDAFLNQDPDGLLGWIESVISSGGKSEGILAVTASDLPLDELEEFSTWFSESVPPGIGLNAARTIALRRGNDRPHAAMEWAEGLPKSYTRTIAVAAAAEAWVLNDPHAATRHLELLSEDPGNDLIVGGVTKALAESGDPLLGEVALDWAQTIKTEAYRNEILHTLAKSYRHSNPESLERWIAEQSLDAGVRDILAGAREDATLGIE